MYSFINQKYGLHSMASDNSRNILASEQVVWHARNNNVLNLLFTLLSNDSTYSICTSNTLNRACTDLQNVIMVGSRSVVMAFPLCLKRTTREQASTLREQVKQPPAFTGHFYSVPWKVASASLVADKIRLKCC